MATHCSTSHGGKVRILQNSISCTKCAYQRDSPYAVAVARRKGTYYVPCQRSRLVRISGSANASGHERRGNSGRVVLAQLRGSRKALAIPGRDVRTATQNREKEFAVNAVQTRTQLDLRKARPNSRIQQRKEFAPTFACTSHRSVDHVVLPRDALRGNEKSAR